MSLEKVTVPLSAARAAPGIPSSAAAANRLRFWRVNDWATLIIPSLPFRYNRLVVYPRRNAESKEGSTNALLPRQVRHIPIVLVTDELDQLRVGFQRQVFIHGPR